MEYKTKKQNIHQLFVSVSFLEPTTTISTTTSTEEVLGGGGKVDAAKVRDLIKDLRDKFDPNLQYILSSSSIITLTYTPTTGLGPRTLCQYFEGYLGLKKAEVKEEGVKVPDSYERVRIELEGKKVRRRKAVAKRGEKC